MNESTQLLIFSVGAPFIIGLAVGFFAKKTIKVALFIAGFAIVAAFVLEFYDVTTINNEHLKQVTDVATHAVKESTSFLTERLTHITGQSLTAVAGFIAGLKLG